MNQPDLIQHIADLLRTKVQVPPFGELREETRLQDDLSLDSVRVLQLLVHLELDLGFEVPEEALSRDQFATIGSLTRFLLELRSPRSRV